jgi:hypothetical protein
MWDGHLPSMFHMHAVVALGKMKRHLSDVMKTAHGLFPKAFLQESLSSAPGRSRVHLISTVDGVQLVAMATSNVGVKLCFFCAVGDGDMANGSPFIQRWADESGNIATRAIPRSHVFSTYF